MKGVTTRRLPAIVGRNATRLRSRKRVVGVDLFAGAGGMSLGAELAGVKVCLAVEIDPHATETYRKNHPSTELIVQDVRALRRIGPEITGEVRILFGGPPCQGFSTSNQRTRTARNPANWLFHEFIRIVAVWTPDWVVFENVRGIAETDGGRFLALVVEGLEALGYRASCWALNAADYGVPQKRVRLFVIGSRDGMEVAAPMPLNGNTPVTVREAISDLPILPNGASDNWLPYKCPARYGYAMSMRDGIASCANHLVTRNAAHVVVRYAHVPPGGNWMNIPSHLMGGYANLNGCHTGIYHRLRPDAPSVVVGNYRKNMLIHPTQDRGLSVREAARLQSFPDWYEFTGSIGFQQQQVGNAVPPLLAKAVFASVLGAAHARGRRTL